MDGHTDSEIGTRTKEVAQRIRYHFVTARIEACINQILRCNQR
jgi:hypothetical protein